MTTPNTIQAKDMRNRSIKITEPFAQYLMAEKEEYEFEITLLDVVRFAGHACPSMIGAFIMAQRAITELFPETKTCIRGQVAIDIPASADKGATGPISNVFSMIFGAWEKSGFVGLRGEHARRNLLRYDANEVPAGHYRFRNLLTSKTIDIAYDPSKVEIPPEIQSQPFQQIWRYKITKILERPDNYLTCKSR